ncbi:hypothetical protein T439DRAFT_328652 [Meredithblackwellia eburnea MCA 4105]
MKAKQQSQAAQDRLEIDGLGPRISQRAPTSCTFCYRRKIKCSARENQTFPCSNCLKRGVADSCARESVIVRGSIVGGTGDPQPLSDDQLRVLSEAQLRTEVAQLRKKIQQQERLITSLQRSAAGLGVGVIGGVGSNGIGNGKGDSPGGPSALSTHSSPAEGTPTGGGGDSGGNSVASSSRLTLDGSPRRDGESKPLPGTSQGEDGDILRPWFGVLGLPVRHGGAAGGQLGSRRLPSGALDGPVGPPAWKLRRGLDGLGNYKSLTDLVPIEQSSFLVETSLNVLDWIHCVVHVPSYVKEHRVWVDQLRRGKRDHVKDEYLAVYFAIISSGLYFLDKELGAALGLSPQDIVTLPHLWFEASVEALHRSDFMTTPTFEAVQTITILTLVCHNYGASAYLGSLLHMGLKIGQSLSLHLLGPETPDSPTAGLIKRELGRRAWVLLRIAESHSDTNNPGALFLPPAITVEPANVNDENLSDAHPLLPRPLNEPTLVSHMVAMGRHARIFRDFQQNFFASGSLEEQYQCVLDADERLLRLLRDFPALQPNSDPYPLSVDITKKFDYLPMSKFLWALAIAPSRILLFKSFLGRSYSDPRFGDARRVCIDAARAVLHERRRPVPSLYERAWHISAYTVLAGVVLATEYIHGGLDEAGRSVLRAEIYEIIQILPRAGPSNKVVLRGVDLLQRVLQESMRAPPVETFWPAPPQEEYVPWANPADLAPDIWDSTLRTFETQDDPFWQGDRWWTG